MLVTYDPKEVTINWNGKSLASGLAPDSFVTVSRAEDSFSKTVGADGTVARTRIADRTGEVELTLMQNSPINAILSTLALADELSSTGDVASTVTGEVAEGASTATAGIAGVSNLTITDPSGGLIAQAKNAWIRKIPDQELGKEYGERTWTFDCENVEIIQVVATSV